MKVILRLLLACSFMGLSGVPARADIWDLLNSNTQVVGMVSYVQSNHFLITAGDNSMVRVFLAPGQSMPPAILPGMKIQAVLRTENGVYVLDRIQAVQGPNGLTPIITSPR